MMANETHIHDPRVDSCRNAREGISDWLVPSGSGSEARDLPAGLRSHLAGCSSCRDEVAESLEAWTLFDTHVPTLDLSFYALGLPTEIGAERIEAHLELCSACRDELALVHQGVEAEEDAERSDTVEPGRVSSFPSRRRQAPAAPDWRRLAAAAGIAAVVTASGFAWLVDSGTHPEDASSARVAESTGPTPGTVTDGSVLFLDGFESGAFETWSPVGLQPTEGPDADEL